MSHEDRAAAHFVAEVFQTLRHEEEVGNLHSLNIHGNVAYYYANSTRAGRAILARLIVQCENTPLTLSHQCTDTSRYVITLKEAINAN